ncbi:methyltransferase domain-containing protein [Candidatus Bathyarchaeota archaeon]|nr:methyltransferase domain-containing protein [Candidatus Bathyarchaeota archaeon]MBS7631335.1 methyltransferase domain-containing protein [Candidatus Bathyarchaeota archaeon]
MTGKPQDRYVHAGKLEEVMRLEAQAKAFGKVLEKEFEIVDLKPGMKVLDAGCGTGAVARKMATKVSPGEVYGIDIDPLFICEARKLAANEGVSNVRFELGDVDSLKYGDGTFDISYCRLVLMHVKNPVKTVTELKRVTKKGGVVAVSDNDDGGVITYPEMPKMMDLWTKYGRSAKIRGEDRYIGRQLFSIFSHAGLSPITIYPLPIHATQQTPEMLKMLVLVPVQIMEQCKENMMREGLVAVEHYEEAMKEVQAFLSHPGAFAMGLTFLAVGKVT